MIFFYTWRSEVRDFFTLSLWSFGYLYAETFTVGAELGGVHALEGGDTVREITGVGDTQVVFEDVDAFTQRADEEVSRGVFDAFVVPYTILEAVSGKGADRLEAGGAHVFEVYILVVAIGAQFHPDSHYVADFQPVDCIGRIAGYRLGDACRATDRIIA